MIKFIHIILIGFLLTGCVLRQAPYSIEDVEKHRWLYKQQGKRKSLDILVSIYQDQNEPLEVRLEALRAIAEVRDPIVVSALQSAVKNASLIEMEMMLQSVDILAEFHIPESTDSLIIGLANTERKVMEIREAIVNAVGRNGTEDEILTLLELYEVSRSNHARMNKLMTLALGGMDDDRVIPILMEIAKDTEVDLHIRNRAVEILARRESPELVDFFVEMLGDPVTRDKVNEYAMNVLGEFNNERMIFALLEAYQTGKHQYYALLNTLIKNLSNYNNPAIKPVFAEVATTEGFPRSLRIKAIRALARFKDPSIVNDVIAILEHPANYIYYNEIVILIQELDVYDNYKSKLRKAAFDAMLADVREEVIE